MIALYCLNNLILLEILALEKKSKDIKFEVGNQNRNKNRK